MSPQTITKLERGTTTPSFDTLEKLVDVLDVPPVAFFSVGMPAVPTGERGKLVEKIHIILARMNEDTLSRAHKMLQALVD
jgi:transcriptional regulator with XRE-family HTH domain